jgi:hypothetical protein
MNPTPTPPKILIDRGIILANLITGCSITINDGKWPQRGAWLNRYTENEVIVDYLFAQELYNAKCLQLDSGNWETGDRHYYFRVLTRKKKGRWRLDVTKDDETDKQMPFRESLTPTTPTP